MIKSPEEVAAFTLGRKTGRQEMLDEIFELLGLDKKISEAIASHERIHHE